MNYSPETSYKETLECVYAVHEGDETKGSQSINQSINRKSINQ